MILLEDTKLNRGKASKNKLPYPSGPFDVGFLSTTEQVLESTEVAPRVFSLDPQEPLAICPHLNMAQIVP